MVTNKQQVIDLLKKNCAQLQKFGVRRIGVFGSYATGDQNEQSDIDLLVEFNEGQKTFRSFMGTANFTEDILGKNVDLVTLESLSPYIAPYVEKEVEYVQTSNSRNSSRY